MDMSAAGGEGGGVDDGKQLLTGMILMASAMFIIPMMDVTAKYLTGWIPPLEVAFGRFFFQMVVAIVIALVGPGLVALKPQKMVANLLRGVCLSIASVLFFTAVKYMPVATATAIFFVEPMILTALSALILKEKVGPRRWAAVIVGFLGVVIILQPGLESVGYIAALPLGAACFFALYLLTTKHLSQTDTMLSVQFTTGVAGSVLLGSALIVTTYFEVDGATFIEPLPWVLLGLFLMGCLAYLGHGLVVLAFGRAPASVLAPFNYLEIVSATALGYVIFNEFPNTQTWVGLCVIVACGLYIANREHRLKRAELAAQANHLGAAQ